MTFSPTEYSDGLRFYASQASATPLLTYNETIALFRKAKRGDTAARDHLILANLRLVLKFAGQYSRCGVPLEDLVSEGNVGLTIAVDRYETRKGGKFSVYAAWWIKNRMMAAMAKQSGAITFSSGTGLQVSKLRKAVAALEDKLGRAPTNEEVSEATGISLRRLTNLQSASMGTRSLQSPVGYDPDTGTLEDQLADTETPNPADLFDHNSHSEDIRAAVAQLRPDYARVITDRFGLSGEPPMTLTEIGERVGVTRERIRQIEFQAMRQLRALISRQDKPHQAALNAIAAAPRKRYVKKSSPAVWAELAQQRAA